MTQIIHRHRLSCLGIAVAVMLSGPEQPVWVFAPAAGTTIRQIWDGSVTAQQERVGCLAGAVGPDTVSITEAQLLDPGEADSLTANAEASLEQCGPPRWIGTIHTHVRSVDDPSPAAHFSGQDRVVMSLWATRWRRPGAFCVAYGPREAHCEVFPLRAPVRESATPD